MPKLSFTRPKLSSLPSHANHAWRFWSHLKTLDVAAISKEAEQPFLLSLVGTEDQTALLSARLALESPAPRDLGPQGPADIRPYICRVLPSEKAPSGSLVLNADALTADEGRLAAAMTQLALGNSSLRLSLARHIPAFRPAVTAQLIGDAAKENARVAVLSALPGILPFTSFLSPATALGDMVILTRNQVALLLRIAAAYGQEIDLRARTRELLPVVGSAFGWRAAARELIGMVPGGIGLVVKGSVAYAGTYTVGKAAAVYYSTGQTLTSSRLRQLYLDSLRDAAARVRPLWKKSRGVDEAEPPLDIARETRV